MQKVYNVIVALSTLAVRYMEIYRVDVSGLERVNETVNYWRRLRKRVITVP